MNLNGIEWRKEYIWLIDAGDARRLLFSIILENHGNIRSTLF